MYIAPLTLNVLVRAFQLIEPVEVEHE